LFLFLLVIFSFNIIFITLCCACYFEHYGMLYRFHFHSQTQYVMFYVLLTSMPFPLPNVCFIVLAEMRFTCYFPLSFFLYKHLHNELSDFVMFNQL